ncbi:MAG: PIN domain-containing protein [Deltaproteobacteria bacterium]|nr:PIN domain-containing protein [Deltaproteobacteria bacterium]
MIGLDTNILIDMLVASQPDHTRAAQWLTEATDRLATTHVNVGEILRLLTHPRVFPTPIALAPAVTLLQTFVEEFNVWIMEESATWWQELPDLLPVVPGLKGNEVFDARIALCLRHNGVKEWCTKDTDFAKYPFLKIVSL